MSEHYYTSKPTVKHDRRTLEVRLLGRMWTFRTDAGVFSKGDVDYGSRLLIETMTIPQDAEVLDVGCGYGPIGIAAASMADRGTAVLVDVNERALELAAENAETNRIRNVQVLQSDLFAALAGRTFTHIVSNPPIRAGKQVVHRLFEEAHRHLKLDGELWIVIQKKQGAPSAVVKLEQLFDRVEVAEQSKGYKIIKAVKNTD